MTPNEKKVALLTYMLEGGLLTIDIENKDTGKKDREVVGIDGDSNEFGVYDDAAVFTPIPNISLKQFLCLAETIDKEDLVNLILNRNMNQQLEKEDEAQWT